MPAELGHFTWDCWGLEDFERHLQPCVQMGMVGEGPRGSVGGEDPGPKVEPGVFCSMRNL